MKRTPLSSRLGTGRHSGLKWPSNHICCFPRFSPWSQSAMSRWGSVSACLLFGFSRLPYILHSMCVRMMDLSCWKVQSHQKESGLMTFLSLFPILSLHFHCLFPSIANSPSISLFPCSLALILSIFSSWSQRSWHLCHRSSPPSLLWRWPLLKFHSNPLYPFRDRQQSEQCKLLTVIDSQLWFGIYQDPTKTALWLPLGLSRSTGMNTRGRLRTNTDDVSS